MPFADVEKLLVGWLGTNLGVRVLTDTPLNLADILPVVRVTRFGGADTDVVLDRANVDVDCYAATRLDAYTLCEQVRGALLFSLAGKTVSRVTVARVQTISGPAWRPWDNTSLRRFGATYQLTTKTT